MKQSYKNELGLTLVELLAAIVIGTIIMIFVTSILTQSLNEQKRQTTNNEQLAEMRYVIKLITKDMRKSTDLGKINDNEYKFTSLNNSTIAIYKFDLDSHVITRRDVVIGEDVAIASNISELIIEDVDGRIEITIKSLNGNTIETELYFRGGN